MDINAHTQFCCVIGNPVEHSLSPAIHNAAFQKLGLNFVYLAFRVEAIGDAIKGLRALGNFRGASVTLPHKVTSIPFLDSVESTARHIGAINTIMAEGGTLTGYNTDATGALRAFRDGGVTLKGRQVVMLGSGGAARAIAFALGTEAGINRLTVLGINDQERTTLVRDLRLKTGMTVQESSLDENTLQKVLPDTHVLIHCTPMGMSPNVYETSVPASLLHAGLTVMDIVYN
ncbi:MAG: shikimate dehydrogenase, partial [Nitrospirota bacterium]